MSPPGVRLADYPDLWLMTAEAHEERVHGVVAARVRPGCSVVRIARCEADLLARRGLVLGLLTHTPIRDAWRYWDIAKNLDVVLALLQSAKALAAFEAVLRDNTLQQTNKQRKLHASPKFGFEARHATPAQNGNPPPLVVGCRRSPC